MRTGYFARYRGSKGVSIALYPIKGYTGRRYPPLYPSPEILAQFKRDGDTRQYMDRYYDEILSKLDPKKVWEDLGEDAVLLCYEKAGDFCHRRLVAEWLSYELGVDIPEYINEKELEVCF